MDTAIKKKNTVFVWKVIITGLIVQSLDVSISKPFKTFIWLKCNKNVPDCKRYHFKSIFSVTKFLITTGIHGYGQNYKSRLIDLSINASSTCFDWPILPNDVYGATGGLVSNTPLICGGWNHGAYQASDECHIIDGRKPTLNTTMILKRYRAASIVLNENTLWITGGKVDLGVRTLNVDELQEFQNYYMFYLIMISTTVSLLVLTGLH